MSKIVGIDPGLEGAVAVLEDGFLNDAFDLPHVDKVLDARELAVRLQEMNLDTHDIVVVERVSAFPQNGSIGNFKLGYSFGCISGVVKSLGLAMDTTAPAMWKKRLGLAGKTKDSSRLLIRDMFPETADLFARKMDNGRSDAACIALDYYRQHRLG
jgi:crossover junction endodeoxyribonuclease RuvC